MKSTGEVYGSDVRADVAYLKARLATEIPVASEGGAYLTVRDGDKEQIAEVAKELSAMGFNLFATPGTADAIRNSGTEVTTVYRIADRKHPDALDLMRKGEVWLRSGEITLEILDPITNTEQYTVEELTTNLYNLIDSKLKI